MSLYNSLFNKSLIVDPILQYLSIDYFERFRDAWIEIDPGYHIVVLTRCGGVNRNSHGDMFTKLRNEDSFISSDDDPFDSTYCYLRFKLDPNSLFGKEIQKMFDHFRDSSGFPHIREKYPLKKQFERSLDLMKERDLKK